jgi:hypothetical protein
MEERFPEGEEGKKVEFFEKDEIINNVTLRLMNYIIYIEICFDK